MKKNRMKIILMVLISIGMSCQSSVNLTRDEFKKATIATFEDSSYTAEDKALTDSLDSLFYRDVPDNGDPSAKLVVKYAADKDDGSNFNKEAILSLDGDSVILQLRNLESEGTLKIDEAKKDAKVKIGQVINLTAEINFQPLIVDRLARAKTIGLRLYLGPAKKPVTVNYSPKVVEKIQQWAAIGRK